MTRGLTSTRWGALDGRPVLHHRLENALGWSLEVCDAGATLTGLRAPDRDGVFEDVLLGHERLDDLLNGQGYLGSVVGRCANRIAGARFRLDGAVHELTPNEGPNQLHGGPDGFHRKVWAAHPVERDDGVALALHYTSPHGDQGHPGTLEAEVVYTLSDAGELRTEMTACADRPTLCNLAQHAYWNLGGHQAGALEQHCLRLQASQRLAVDSQLIPTGEIVSVAGTRFDFTEARVLDCAFDDDFLLDGPPDGAGLRSVAVVTHAPSGRWMELLSDQAHCQLYTGDGLDGSERGKGGVHYPSRAGFCLETQAAPDAVNQAGWDAPLLRPGDTYRHVMVTRFGVDRDGAQR